MQVEVEINSTHIIDNTQESEKNKCTGEITYYNKGAILEFTEKHEEQELKFKMSILENKIITYRNNQSLIFDLEHKSKSALTTPYGEIKINLTTKKIKIVKSQEQIKEINLEYEIELENGMKYDNLVDIVVK